MPRRTGRTMYRDTIIMMLDRIAWKRLQIDQTSGPVVGREVDVTAGCVLDDLEEVKGIEDRGLAIFLMYKQKFV